MSVDLYARAKDVFLEACDLPADERSRFVLEVCGIDDGLRGEVEALLTHDPSLECEDHEPETVAFPTAIQNYRLAQRIGGGGMGDVWEAEQLAPVRRRVALKLIRAGIAGRDVLARFEAERQALALMSHNNIATVLEAGETEGGQPFFAMELVRGVPITDYCDRNRLGLRERLGLFMRVCDGVQHAHHKGVIHRDIKPSNVLVTEEEGRPVPKIIDFGVAKATSLRLTERTLHTETGQWIGTPEYMSPEQAGLTDTDVDTRTDVYALGVLLYELLVGTQPFDAETLRRAGFSEMCRILKEEDPPRPSTRVSTLGEHSEAVARRRSTDGSALARLLRGDLDWIVLKALEKDRERRYRGPADLAADVLRYLRNETVLARSPGTLYRLKKLVVRNRVVVVAGVMVLAALVAGIAGTTHGMVQARREAESARLVAESMVAVFESLSPSVSPGQLDSARQALTRGADVIKAQLDDEPMVRGRLMKVMGETSTNMELCTEADTLLDDALTDWSGALGDDHPAIGELHSSLGWNHLCLGHYAAAETSFAHAHEIFERHLGPENAATGWALASRGLSLWRIGDYERSRSTLDSALRILEAVHGAESDLVAGVLEFKGVLLTTLWQLEAARNALTRSATIRERWFGADHPVVASSLTNLAMAHLLEGDLDRAEELFRRALEINRRAFGEDHVSSAYPLRELGLIEAKRGHLEAARQSIAQALAVVEQSRGPDHPELIWTLRAQGIVLRRSGETEAAHAVLERALAIARSAHGPTHFEVAMVMHSLGYLEYEQGHLALARAHYEDAAQILLEVFPPEHHLTGVNCYQQACLAALQGDQGEAITLLRRAFATDWVSDIVLEDPDLDSLRADPEFASILAEVRGRLELG